MSSQSATPAITPPLRAARLPAWQPAALSGALPFVCGCLLLGTIGIFVANAQTDPLTLVWFRCAFGWLGLTIWILLRQQGHTLRLSRTDLRMVTLAGSLLIAAWVLFFIAIQQIPTGMAVVLFHVQPLWLLLLGLLWLKEPVGMGRLLAVAVALLGLLLATGLLESAQHGVKGTAFWLGIAACLLGALCTAAMTLTAKRLGHLPGRVITWWQCAIGTAVLALWPLTHGWPSWGSHWGWLMGLGLLHTALVYSLMYAGMAQLATGRIALLQFVYPAVAVAIDWLYFQQTLDPWQWLGIGLICIAIWATERQPKTRHVTASPTLADQENSGITRAANRGMIRRAWRTGEQ